MSLQDKKINVYCIYIIIILRQNNRYDKLKTKGYNVMMFFEWSKNMST